MIVRSKGQKIIKRTIDGVLLLDKPRGITSNNAVQRIKNFFHAKKAGHTGNLDPLADGMLPICLGEATKFSQYLLDADKTYLVKIRLGIRTASGDSEAEIISQRPVPELSKHKFEKTMTSFCGVIEQTPSMYSALKYKGQPLYKLAHQGIEVERKSRCITIYQLNLLDFKGEMAELYVHCSKGTYVRTLVDDLGEALGCGAHVIALRRLTVVHYLEDQMVSLAYLEREYENQNKDSLDSHLLPIESMVAHFPVLKLSKATVFYLQQGQPVMVPHAPTQGFVRLRTQANQFIGIGEVLTDARIAPRRLIKTH